MGGKPRSQTQAARPGPRSAQILEVLGVTWAHAVCELDHDNAYQLLVATILSAQSTDKRVNMVTPDLFKKYPTARKLARATADQLEPLIHSTGFYRMKTKHLLGMAQTLVEHFGGEVPKTIEALITLPGVARKTANVVLGTVFGITSGIVVDTHVLRVSRRLALTQQTKPEAVERDLMNTVPREHWIEFGHQMIWHGRRICHARKPNCEKCPLAPLCPEAEAGLGTGA